MSSNEQQVQPESSLSSDKIKPVVNQNLKSLQNIYPAVPSTANAVVEKPQPEITNPQSHRKSRRIKITALVVISLLIVSVAMSKLHSFSKKEVIINRIAEQRTVAEKDADQELSSQIEALSVKGMVDSSLASSKLDVCYVTHADAGWTYAYWYQDCYIRYVEGFSTSLSKTEIIQRIGKYSDLFGETASGRTSTLYPCRVADKDGGAYETIRFRSANTPVSTKDDCKIPRTIQAIFSVRGPIMFDEELSTRTYRTFDYIDIDNTQSQVWISFDKHYYHEKIGCGFLFCNNPRSEPIHPAID